MAERKHEPTNYPRAEIMKMADQAIRTHGGPNFARVYFKFSCAHCGERCTFDEPNKLHEQGECWKCHGLTDVVEAGFALHMTTNPRGFAADNAESN
jgi:hypothetical protein